MIKKKIPPREVAPIKSEYSFDSPEEDKELKKQAELLFKQKQEREAAEEKANHGKPSQEVAKITNKKEEPEDEYDYDFD